MIKKYIAFPIQKGSEITLEHSLGRLSVIKPIGEDHPDCGVFISETEKIVLNDFFKSEGNIFEILFFILFGFFFILKFIICIR